MSDPAFHELFPLGEDDTPYRKLTGDFVSTASFEGQRIVKVEPQALTVLTRTAMRDIAHLLRPGHLAQLRAILDDKDASPNDHFVALDPQPLGGDLAVGRRVLAEREQRRVLIGRQRMGGQGGVHRGCQRGW